MAVPITAGETFTWDSPSVLFRGAYLRNVVYQRAYDVAPDGRFLMRKLSAAASGEGRTPQIEVVFNWFEELRARVPVP